MSLTSLGSLLAFDNIVAALALAPLCRNRVQFLRLIAWFAAVEAMAPVAGVLLQPHPQSLLAGGWVAAAIVMTLGLSLLGLASARRSTAFAERLASGGWPTAMLAIVLGLDNLIAGAGLPLSSAALCGAASAGAVVAACLVGRAIGLRLTLQARTVVCGILLVTAGAMTWA